MMKKLLFFVFVLLLPATRIFSQALPNGDFENWNTSLLFNLDKYECANADALIRIKQSNCVQTSDAQNGNYAIRLETKANSTDTVCGYFVNANIKTGKGGLPFSQSPSTLSGYYKCGVKAGDSALIVVIFKKAGATLFQDVFYFTGTQNTYTAFTYTLSAFSSSPDSLIIGAAVGNPLKNKGIPGSFLQLDNLTFGGTGITQQIPNGNFENWTITDMEEPIGWSTKNLYGYRDQKIPYISKILASNSKMYAIRISTLMIDNGKSFLNTLTTGKFTKNGYDHGLPFTNLIDTLTGYYNYIPTINDTANISITCYKNGVSVGGGHQEFWDKTMDYTQFKIPITCSQTPDSMRIDVSSSGSIVNSSKVGSILILDNLSLHSDPVNIYFYGKGATISVFPNPAVNEIHFNFGDLKIDLIEIVDINGISIETIRTEGQQDVIVDSRSYPSGNYFYKLSNNNGIISRGKFTIVK